MSVFLIEIIPLLFVLIMLVTSSLLTFIIKTNAKKTLNTLAFSVSSVSNFFSLLDGRATLSFVLLLVSLNRFSLISAGCGYSNYVLSSQ